MIHRHDIRNRVCIIGPTYFIEIIDNFLGIIAILTVIGDNLVIKFELIVVIKIRISVHIYGHSSVICSLYLLFLVLIVYYY